MTSLTQGLFEVEWLGLEAEYFKGHEHEWAVIWEESSVAVCVAPMCPSLSTESKEA